MRGKSKEGERNPGKVNDEQSFLIGKKIQENITGHISGILSIDPTAPFKMY